MRGQHKGYDAKLDYEEKIKEMRAEWVERQQHNFSEKKGWEEAEHDDHFGAEIHNYFKRTTDGNGQTSSGVLQPEKIADGSDSGNNSDEITREK